MQPARADGMSWTLFRQEQGATRPDSTGQCRREFRAIAHFKYKSNDLGVLCRRSGERGR